MALFKRDGDSLRVTQLRAINHPLRCRLLEIHLRERRRSFSVNFLTAALAETREFSGVGAAEVKYHLTRLQDAQLLPGG
jgi:hypothetical protein